MIIPKTIKSERLEENIKVYDFSLSDDEYEKIAALDKCARFTNP
jgi:diketogulonate reductase-like aldo/keto reductase